VSPAIHVRHHARALNPGEVVLLEVELPSAVAFIAGEAFSRPVRFYPTDRPAAWRGLVGIDLNTKPGRYGVALVATGAEGQKLVHEYALDVQPKTFDARRLTVDTAFVNPPESVVDRIQREARRLNEIFQTATTDMLWSGKFVVPVPGDPTSSFGRRSIFNGQPRSPHGGTDFRAGAGTPIKAPNGGRVVLSDEHYFSGNVVTLDHGWGLYSYFAHLSQRLVQEGEMVHAGQVIGHVGATGRVTGPHLHWAVRLNNALVDPLSLIAATDDGLR
jgi:murein DD-endopeptidase MepM/ murein hydrolase activator NlpD